MTDVYWRVDSGLLTLESVNKDVFKYLPPVGKWLPVLMGSGLYAYFETLEEAKEEYLKILNEQLIEIQRMIKYAEQIKEK